MKRLWLAVAILLGLGLFGLSAEPSAAQDYQSLRNQIDQLRQQVRELSGQVNDLSRGGVVSSGATGGGAVGAGESPGMVARLDEVMESMRRLNGRIEELEFKVDTLSRGLDAMKRSAELAPTTSVAPAVAAPPAAVGSTTPSAQMPNPPSTPVINEAGVLTVPAPESTVATSGGGFSANEAPRTLGSMPIDPGSAPASAEPQPAPAPAAEAPAQETPVAAVAPATPKDQYDAAHRLLKNGQYAEAEAAFRQFLDANPKDPNVAKASYWLGETYYARKQYDQAYQVYARNLQRWPKGEKAPDNLVKLSLSLVSLKRDSEACQFLAVLDSDYPNAAANVKQAGERAKKLAKCK